MKKKYCIVLTLIISFIIVSFIFSYYLVKSNFQTIVSTKYHISLKIDKNWIKDDSLVDTLTYKGKDGFIKIGLLTGEYGGLKNTNNNKKFLNIDMVTNEAIKNSSMGNHFQIISLKIDSQDSRLIIPTNNKSSEAILLVKYPKNIKISAKGILFNYLQVRADRNHIKNIANSIKFIIS